MRTLEQRFLEKVPSMPTEGCWPWGASTSNGYGQIMTRRADGTPTMAKAHAVAHQLFIRPQQQAPRPSSSVTFSSVESVHLEPDADEDETLNEILDLIAPNGFKARHLPLIDQFKRSALALMREVNGGS